MQKARILLVLTLALTLGFAAALSADAQFPRSCNKRSLIKIFRPQLFCGKNGFITTNSINGDCPISACIIAPRQQTRSVFGPVF